MIAPAVKRAFEGQTVSKKPVSKPSIDRGGLEVVFRVQLGVGLMDVTQMSGEPLIAAATADGVVSFMDAGDGHVTARCDSEDMDAPNAMEFASKWLVHCSDDCVRIVESAMGKIVHTHQVAEHSDLDHAIVIDGPMFVVAAGRLVHACAVPTGELQHSMQTASAVRAMCAAPRSASQWAYAIAHKEGVRLVSAQGEAVSELSSQRMLRSLDACGPWLAAAASDGTVELWDLARPLSGTNQPHCSLNGNCGSDGASLCWKGDGAGLAISGRRAAVFDFTGSNPNHPYRKQSSPPAPGWPDSVPRVCMSDGGAQCVAWSPRASPPDAKVSELATVDKEGVVRLWQPWGLPLRKGGVGNPSQPHRMKPQFYTYVKQDAAHPTSEAMEPCVLKWLCEDVVAVGYYSGEIVAWRVAR